MEAQHENKKEKNQTDKKARLKRELVGKFPDRWLVIRFFYFFRAAVLLHSW